MKKQILTKEAVVVLVVLVVLVILGMAMQSCNVVRTISNKSEYYQRGDTAVMIQTKTTESYDAKKNMVY